MLRRLIVASLILTGCGSSTSQDNSIPQTTGPSVLSGRILTAEGSPVADIPLVVHERTTNQKTMGRSAADGSFSLTLPAGYYDVGLDGPDANSFYGPVAVLSETRRDFVLQDGRGRPADLLWGKISTEAGTPAAGRRLQIRPAAALKSQTLPGRQTTSTDGSGAFQISLGTVQEVGLDLEIYDTEGLGKLSEYVDLAKRAKPCYAEFALSPVKNRLRYGRKDGPRPASSKVPEVRLSTVAGNPSITQYELADNGATLQNGFYPPQSGSTPFSMLVDGGIPPGSPFSFPIEDVLDISLSVPYMAVDSDGDWWYTYAVTVGVGPFENTINWVFTDSTGDTYSLEVEAQGTHEVSYNSDGPAITQVSWSFGGPVFGTAESRVHER